MKDFETPRDASIPEERIFSSSKHEIYQFFHFLEPFLLELYPDPDCESGSGSRSGDPLNPDPMQIRIRNTAGEGKNCSQTVLIIPSDRHITC